jgi:hypothetical protein
MAGNVTGLILTNYPARSSQDLVVALVLGDAADQDGGNVYPSIRRVAALARCGERTVQYCIQEFIRQGFLVLLEKGGGRGNPSRYRIDLDWLWSQPPVWRPLKKGASDAPIPETAQEGEKKGAERMQKGCKKGAPAIAPNPRASSLDPLRERRASGARPGRSRGGALSGGGVEVTKEGISHQGNQRDLDSLESIRKHPASKIQAAVAEAKAGAGVAWPSAVLKLLTGGGAPPAWATAGMDEPGAAATAPDSGCINGEFEEVEDAEVV